MEKSKGSIFSKVQLRDVDSEASANTVVEMFKKFDDVKVETVEPLQAIYAKGQLKLAETQAA